MITTHSLDKAVFVGSTMQEANHKADDWWMRQKGVREVRRSKISGGFTGPSLRDAGEFTVTIHYEPERVIASNGRTGVMNRKAVEAARIEFNRAWDSVHALGEATDYNQIQTHWAAFLSAAARVFNKLRAGAKAPPRKQAMVRCQSAPAARGSIALLYLARAQRR